MSSIRVISRTTAQQAAIIRQNLHQRPQNPDKMSLKKIIRQLGLLQLDSINVTARSHYLVMLSRAGLYSVDDLDALLPERAVFEYWAHAACMIPMEDFGYFYPHMLAQQEPNRYLARRLGDDPQQIIDQALNAIREQGALSSGDFEHRREEKGSWWNWKPAKAALEYLYDCGRLMVSHRRHFHRYYDLPERVLDGIDVARDKSLDDWREWAVPAGLRPLGVGWLADIADYYRMKKQPAREALSRLEKSGEVLKIQVEGIQEMAYIHQEDLPLLDEIEAGKHPFQVTSFLSPFDNLIWYRDRTERLFDLFYRVEMYTPSSKRKYGYYVLPILHRDRLIGRIDPKIDREARRFIIRALHLEAGILPDSAMIDDLAACIREFMRFHDCDTFALEECADGKLKKALLKAVS